MIEDRGRHVRVAHQVVRRADQLVASEATDFGKDVVAVGDLPFQVGGRDEALLVGEGIFTLGYGLVVTHRLFTPGIECSEERA